MSLLTLFTAPAPAPAADLAERRHQVDRLSAAMIRLYVGGLLIAGGITRMPGRLMRGWLFGER